MAWVRFTADMDWKPKSTVTIAYKAGMVRNVPRAAAAAAVGSGRGVALTKPSREAKPVETRDEA